MRRRVGTDEPTPEILRNEDGHVGLGRVWHPGDQACWSTNCCARHFAKLVYKYNINCVIVIISVVGWGSLRLYCWFLVEISTEIDRGCKQSCICGAPPS